MARKAAKPEAAGAPVASDVMAVQGGSAAPVNKVRRKQAVVVVHGMGEQRPMETLRDLASSLAGSRNVFIIPDQATGSAELARIRVPGRNGDPSTDFYELYYADLLGGGTFAQLRGWVLGLMVRWPHQVPKEVWRIWIFLWALVLFTLWWLGPLLANDPVGKVKSILSGMADPLNRPNGLQLVLLAACSLLLSARLSIMSQAHVNSPRKKPNPQRTLAVYWSYLVPVAAPVVIAYAAYFVLPWSSFQLPDGWCASSGFFSCAFAFLASILHLEWFKLLIAALVWYVVTKFGVPYFGDVARYVRSNAESIEGRRAIRERGIRLLDELHNRKEFKKGKETGESEYDRIIVVAHSLGTVVAYDVMRIFWAQRNINNFGKVPAVALGSMKAMAALPGYSSPFSTEQINALSGLQDAISLAMRDEKDAWRITDFITMGSPPARADFLMSRDWPRFEKNITERQFPTCPPVLEKGVFTYNNDKAGGETPHHAAMFSATRWLAIYDPVRKLIFGGDFIGGPVKALFGHGISQLAVKITRNSWFFPNVVTHTNYWRTSVTTKFLDAESQIPCDLSAEVKSGQIVINVLRKRIWPSWSRSPEFMAE